MAVDHKSKQTNPQGMVLIWNYQDRITADGAQSPHKIEQVIINSASLKSMSTNKNKAAPAGAFEFRLAPTVNWIARLTPGSWCALLMSQDEFIPPTTNVFPGFANPKTLKMLGRINSVRVVVDVDPETGTRMTEYVITGDDWASVFDTKLYIDPIARNNNLDTNTAVGHAARILFDNMILEWLDNKNAALPTSSQVVKALIKLWGQPLADLSAALGGSGGLGGDGINVNLLLTSQSQFKLPTEVAMYMNLGEFPGLPAVNLASIIQLYDGKLKGLDQYSGDTQEAQGFPDPFSLYGLNTFWQILTDNCNPVLNELVADIRWEGEKPKLALYKRIRPFATRSQFDGSDSSAVGPNISLFKNVRRIDIDLEDVISINAGTNWRDKVNFIEIKPQPQLNQTNFEVQVKLQAQSVDLKAYERDGFKPMIHKVMYMPFDGAEPAPLKATEWKYLLREWYFNTHNMLNGAMTIIGQNQYIQVGDNVRVDARVLGLGPFNKGQDNKLAASDKAYFMAHVEGISHQFNVNPETGARNFISTIQFVRGIIVDSNGEPLSVKSGGISLGVFGGSSNTPGGALDADATSLGNVDEKHANVLGTSTENDPDIQKLKGS